MNEGDEMNRKKDGNSTRVKLVEKIRYYEEQAERHRAALGVLDGLDTDTSPDAYPEEDTLAEPSISSLANRWAGVPLRNAAIDVLGLYRRPMTRKEIKHISVEIGGAQTNAENVDSVLHSTLMREVAKKVVRKVGKATFELVKAKTEV